MGLQHIGRKQAIGIGKESVAGTFVAATAWIPKKQGVFMPKFTKATDDAAYGVIDEVYDSQTTKNMTDVEVQGIMRDNWMGLLLLAAMGTHTLVTCITITGATGGTPARGDAITSATGTFVGTIKKIIVVGTTTYYFVSTTSGTLTDAATNLTNGTWSGGTVGKTAFAGVKGHFFERLNTNNHPSFTIYGSDPVSDDYAPYCMLESLEVEFKVGDYAMFTSKFSGKKLVNTTPQSPVYTADNAFLSKYANVYFGANEAALNAASAVNLQRFKFTVNKNLTDVQAFGSPDVVSIHNQQFGITGDFDAIYTATTLRDYVVNSSKEACRLSAVNTDVAALYNSGDKIYPSIYVDMSRLSFSTWTRTNNNNGLVSQTEGFTGEFNVTDGMTLEILLLNGNASAY